MNTAYLGYMALAAALIVAECWVLRAIAADVTRSRQRKQARIDRQNRAIARRLHNASLFIAKSRQAANQDGALDEWGRGDRVRQA